MFIKIENGDNKELLMAYQKNNIRQFKKLIENGDNVNLIIDKQFLLIDLIIRNFYGFEDDVNQKFFDEILKAKPYINEIKERSGSPIFTAIKYPKNANYLQKLLKYGFDVDCLIMDSEKSPFMVSTPIFHSIYTHNIDIINSLLEYNPDLKITNNWGVPILNVLIHFYGDDAKKVFLNFIKKGADPNQTDSYGNAPLHQIVSKDYIKEDYTEILLNNGADINKSNNSGETPLMIISTKELAWLHKIEILFKWGAKLDKTNNNNQTAIMMAAKNGLLNNFNKLYELGANIHMQDIYGNNVGHYIANASLKSKNPNNSTDLTEFTGLIEFIRKNIDIMFVFNEEAIRPIDIMKSNNHDLYCEIEKMSKDKGFSYTL